MQDSPLVSVIIACLDEEEFIGECLESVLSNDYPRERLEVLVVDGMSKDRTREIVSDYAKHNPLISLIENPKVTTPCALNIGISNAKGEIIVRLDSHASYPTDYISKCIEYLTSNDVQNVGGVLVTKPRDDTRMAKSIAFVFAHPFGSGNAYYKAAHPNQPQLVDTVPFGCFRKEVFQEVGLFDEHLTRSQDIEFNRRLRKAGGRILLVPAIKSVYYVRSNLKDFFKHNMNDGAWVVRPFEYTRESVSLRHLVPLLFVGTLATSLVCGFFVKRLFFLFLFVVSVYSSLTGYYALQIAKRQGDYSLLPYLLVGFAARHIGFGLGSLLALPRVLTSRSFWGIRAKSLTCRPPDQEL
jgi:glycosyltransferase involved in cell wall biosynthesis